MTDDQHKANEVTFIVCVIVLAMFACFSYGCGGVRGDVPHPGKNGSVGGTLNWLIAVGIIGIGASVAAAIWLPVKTIAAASIGGFAAILGLSLFITAITPYLPYFALAIGLFAIGGGIWYFRQWVLATHAVASGTPVPPGIQKIIDRVMAKVKK